jgi:hypothetical protein
MISRYNELRNGILSEDNIYMTFLQYMRKYPKGLMDEEISVYPDTPSAQEMNLSQIINYFRLRAKYIDNEISALAE